MKNNFYIYILMLLISFFAINAYTIEKVQKTADFRCYGDEGVIMQNGKVALNCSKTACIDSQNNIKLMPEEAAKILAYGLKVQQKDDEAKKARNELDYCLRNESILRKLTATHSITCETLEKIFKEKIKAAQKQQIEAQKAIENLMHDKYDQLVQEADSFSNFIRQFYN